MLADPEALDRERPQPELALLLPQLGAAVDVDALAVRELEPQPVEPAARHRTPRDAPLSGSFSVKKTVCQPAWRRSSVTSPSTQSVGSRSSHVATPWLKAGTV